MPSPQQSHACLDLETLGLSLDSVIVSIGGVSWLEGDEPGFFRHTFERKISLNQPGRRIDPDTVIWWMAQSDEARAATFDPAMRVPLDLMRHDLVAWLRSLPGVPLVWTHDPSFDAALLKDDAGNAPWSYRATRCARTAAEYVTNEEHDAIKAKFGAVGHTAVDDAKVSGAQVQIFRNKTASMRTACL